MKVLIAGSRPHRNPHRNHEFTDATASRHDAVVSYVKTLPPGTVVVAGGAHGVDTVAQVTAETRGDLLIEIHYPKWQTYRRGAGHIRNQEMVDSLTSPDDKAVYFWDGRSKGTKVCIEMAAKAKKLHSWAILPEDDMLSKELYEVTRWVLELYNGQVNT